MLTVSGCSRERQHLEGAERICRLTRSLSAEDHRYGYISTLLSESASSITGDRILDLTTFLYIGGLESRVSSSNPPLSSVSFDGCISSLQLNHRLVDLNAPLREGGTHPGCSPLEVSCDRQCPGKDCVEVWNGTLCNCDGNPSLCQGLFTCLYKSHPQARLQNYLIFANDCWYSSRTHSYLCMFCMKP